MDPVTTDSFTTRYPLYVIFSRSSIHDIVTTLSKYGSQTDIYSLKIEYTRDGDETNRTLALLGPSFAGIENQEHSDLRIQRFEIRNTRPYNTKNFCITIPKKLELDATEVKEIITEKLSVLIKAGIISTSDYTLHVPLLDRKNNIPKNSCTLFFLPGIDDETLKVVRAVLYNSTWPGWDEPEGRVFFLIFPHNTENKK